jgi:predicted DsbA family dithiol-disulfide isomerase
MVLNMIENAVKTVTVEIVSDAICPWCWIGKRNLETAAAMVADKVAVETVWRPFELNPDMPPGGVSRPDYRKSKFGSLEFSTHLDAQVAEAGEKAGLTFRHDLMQWTPNTIECHRLIWLAGREGKQDALVEGLFDAYFNKGRNIGDRTVMLDVAEAAGLDRAAAEGFLDSDEARAEVMRELETSRQSGISGVPTFLIDGEPLVSGAVPPDLLAGALVAAAAKA